MPRNHFFEKALASTAVTLRLDPEANRLLRRFAPGNNLGFFVSRLIFEHAAREEEREKLRQEQDRERTASAVS